VKPFDPPRKNSLSARQGFRDRGFHAKRSFGQCFLADQNIARRIAQHSVPQPGGTVLEIGAGTGALTGPLLQRQAIVVAIERDRDLIPLLEESFFQPIADGQLFVCEHDAATSDWLALLSEHPTPHAVVGNIPYQITGRLLQRATQVACHVQRVVFMMQKEVADRIQAPCGSRQYGALSVFVRRSFRVVERISVPPTCFRPQPSVHSAVLVLEPHPTLPPADPIFDELVSAAFSQRRKTLRNAWRESMGLSVQDWEIIAPDAGINLDARAETLCVQDFERLASRLRQVREKHAEGL